MTRFPSRCASLAAGLLALLVLASSARAEKQPPLPAAPPPKQPAEPEDGKAKKPTGRVLTPESLGEMLDTMGYDYKTVEVSGGGLRYHLTIESETWTFAVNVTLSKNKTNVWIDAFLSNLPGNSIPSEPLVRLLQENWTIHPQFFTVSKARGIWLLRGMENQNMTPAKLRGAIDSMTGTIRRTADLWDTSKWGKTEPKAPDSGSGTAAYPDTTEGATKLCKEMLDLAKAGKRVDVTAKVKGFIIPDSDAWFKRVFGADMGTALSEEYTTGLAQLQEGLTRSFMTAAEEGQTDIKVFKFTKSDQEGVTPTQKKIIDSMAVKTPIYSIYLAQPGEETGMHLYSFVYVDGNFRLAGKMKAVAARTSGFRPAVGETPNGGKVEGSPIIPSLSGPPLDLATPRGFLSNL